MAKQNYLKIDEKKIALSAGIIAGILVFLTTINGIFEISNMANFLALSSWALLGYEVSWKGAFIGLIYGFASAFALSWVTIKLYNRLIS